MGKRVAEYEEAVSRLIEDEVKILEELESLGGKWSDLIRVLFIVIIENRLSHVLILLISFYNIFFSYGFSIIRQKNHHCSSEIQQNDSHWWIGSQGVP